MSTRHELFLHEEVLLLALKEKEGTIFSTTNYQFAIAGALTAELILSGKIGFDEGDKKKFVNLLDETLTGNEILDECIGKIKNAKRRANIQNWVFKFSGISKIHHRIAKNLCNKGILKEEEDSILLLFKRKIYPETNPEPEREIIEKLIKLIKNEKYSPEPREIVLLAIAHNTDLIKTFMPKKEQKLYKNHIEKLIKNDLAGKATKEAIEAMHAVIFCTVIATTAATC